MKKFDGYDKLPAVFSPYHCPKCGTAVVFKRILTIEEAAYTAGITVKRLKHLISTKKLKYRLWMAGFMGPQKVIDTADLIELIDKKYPYPDNLDTSFVSVRKYLRLKDQLRRGNVTLRARKEAARLAAEQQASQPPNKLSDRAPASEAALPEPPEDEAPSDQSDAPESRTDGTPSGRSIRDLR